MTSEWLEGGSAVLFVLAHPDDECFCLPLIAAELAGGRSVHVVFLTDGGSRASTREKESLAVLRKAGVRADQIHFAGRQNGWQDGRLLERVKDARNWVSAYVNTMGECARIYVLAYEGGHHDHDCSFGIVASLLRDGRAGGASGLQFSSYTGRGLPGALFRCMSAIPENGPTLPFKFGALEGARYWAVAAAYPSQWRSWIALGPACAWAFLVRRSIEVQRVDPARLTSAPHAGVPYFERRFKVSAAAVREALAGL